jgi:hypothetical protein
VSIQASIRVAAYFSLPRFRKRGTHVIGGNLVGSVNIINFELRDPELQGSPSHLFVSRCSPFKALRVLSAARCLRFSD